MGPLSPISDTIISSPEKTPSPIQNNPVEPPSAIIQDSLKALIFQDGDNTTEAEQEEEDGIEIEYAKASQERGNEDNFNKKLKDWLAENDFCLIPIRAMSSLAGLNANVDKNVISLWGTLVLHESSCLEC